MSDPVSGAVQFQRLDVRHVGMMHELERRCFPLPWSEEQCRAAFAQPAFAAFGLLGGQGLVAYVSVYHTVDELEILNLAVVPEARRQGLGRRILHLSLQVARKMGMHRVLLEVRAGNHAAISLYESSGFQRIGLRPRYYTDSGEDALIYACALAS
ncbi:ribosomal protein S18-alanine N-acetyltransferase [Desulfovibrio sp. ZJ369]|uniref:ribosomal protein S18-alanine N-acetyltransferase n=1 Tax=Desulfovibrio sp. ZJ369 TaxID=2709793 RepID=UPI001F14C6B1|nr:ribosomal protein S18-alanine N-acetyltransferase [Desulfovibrio sp. ZJ369]